MSPRTTALLLVVTALLGAFVWWYEVQGGEKRKVAADAAKRLYPGLDGADVEWIELRTGGSPAPVDVRLERHEGGWRLSRPLEAEGDPVTLDGMATSLAEITSEATIESPEKPEIYGLGDGARVVRFSAKGQEHTLRLGKQAPIGPNTYASADESSAILVVPTYRATSLDKKLVDLRERRILRFDRGAIEGIDVAWPGGAVALEKKGEVWALTAPLQGPADASAVDELLSDAGFLRAEGFIDTPKTDAELGLDGPALRLALRAAAPAGGGEATRFALEIGAPLPSDPKQRAVRVAGGPTYTVGVERLADFPRSVAAYRFKEIVRFDPTEAKRIELTFPGPAGGAPVVETLVQGDAGWALQHSEALRSGEGPQAAGAAQSAATPHEGTTPHQGRPDSADRSLVSGKPIRLVAEISRLTGVDVAAEQGDEATRKLHGLAPPAVTIRVFGAKTAQDEPLLATIEIGASNAQGFIATAGPGAPIYRVDAALAEHVPVSLEAWRARFLQTGAPATGAERPAPPPADAPGDDPDPEGQAEDVFPPAAGGSAHPTP